jgi:phage terminase large subunit-like protein
MVKAAWFSSYAPNERPEKFDRIAQSRDTANKASELSDFSVCTSWGIKGKDLYLLHVLRRRMEFPRSSARRASSVTLLKRSSAPEQVRRGRLFTGPPL